MSEPIIPKSERRLMRYDFTASEVHDLSLQLANKTKELNSVEEEKKTVVSQYAARINETKSSCNRLSNQVADGYEYREVECEIEYHKPAQGQKTLTRKDNGQKIEEKMQEWEWNLFNQPDDNETSELLEAEREKLRG